MSNTIYVSTREELKAALANRKSRIVITDPELGKKVLLVSKASKPAIIAAAAAAGVSVGMAWNPLGWGVALVGTAVTGPLVLAVAFLIVALGLGHLLAIHKGYVVQAGVEVKVPGVGMKYATVLEPK